ncbi:MAG: hypothetical protein QG597_1606 [Actinomycetota bacterium]|nr:hypothetical protein [Actinomycetota bacterium]
MQVVCAHCGGRFEAQRSTAKYCSDKHRMAAAKARRNRENVIPMAPVASRKKPRLHVASDSDIPVPDLVPAAGGDVYDIVDALKVQYQGTSVLRTPHGQLALRLARIVDNGRPDGSTAAEARILDKVLGSLGSGAAAEDDNPLSRRRRARDRSAAGD